MSHKKNASGPFSLNLSSSCRSPLLRRAVSAIEPPLERLLALAQLNEGYRRVIAQKDSEESFVRRALAELDIRYEIQGESSICRIPQEGPAIVVANHPYGGIEGVIMADILERRRPNGKILANFLLSRVAEMQQHFIFVDPFGTRASVKRNLQPIRETIDWVKDGGMLVIFPSGTVSHFHLDRRQVIDPEWNASVARIVRMTGAPVIPIFFEGTNGLLFQSAGLIHPLLRTALIPRELYNKRGKTIRLKIGSPIPPKKLSGFTSDRELMSYLRLRTYILDSGISRGLKNSGSLIKRLSPRLGAANLRLPRRRLLPVHPPHNRDEIAAEIAALDEQRLLIENGDLAVICAPAAEIPTVLKEIGRLRELTFRAVGEGTGKSTDLDHFDRYYWHLFLWNRADREIIGAYRLVKTDEVIAAMGVKGLYTHTLFDYSKALIEQMGPALELGRSFVREEYQRNYNSLNLLWRGIGTFVARNPRHCILFGTVSISSEYDYTSRQLIASFLRANNYLPELAKLIKARNPLRRQTMRGLDEVSASVVVKDLADVSELIAEIETKNKAVPILLKQYLKLGGKFLGFNVDKKFGNVLDGLIYVDLRETEFRLLERYVGREHVSSFLAFHGRTPTEDKTGTCN